jgi:hypothetical protein
MLYNPFAIMLSASIRQGALQAPDVLLSKLPLPSKQRQKCAVSPAPRHIR